MEELTEGKEIYVTKMKKSLTYTLEEDVMYQTTDGLMDVRMQYVTFTKEQKDG